jgi:hypothetical protein
MRLCALCGFPTIEPSGLCAIHVLREDQRWSTGNRLMCDFLHRGVVPTSSGHEHDGSEAFIETLDEARLP